MNISTKLLQAAAGQAGGAGLDVDEVFQTTLWTGNASTQTITTGIDLSGEGGLVWIKGRNATSDHALVDTVRGGSDSLASNNNVAERTDGAYGVTFNSNGFTSTGGNLNVNGREQVAWTWRKAPKFFDVVTYTGTGSAQNISHNLESDVGFLLIKKTDGIGNWRCWHRGLPGTGSNMEFNQTGAYETATTIFNGTDPTSTQFSVGTNSNVNASGGTYVAYLFAHNNSDGKFGPSGDQDIIKCGSYTGNTSTRPSIDLGFEPQFLMIKRTDSADNWYMLDTMRGIVTSAGNDTYLYANSSSAEATVSEVLKVTATGFELEDDFGGWNASGGNYIYMAIRRGPLAAPTDATKVFSMDTFDNSGDPKYDSTHVVDMSLIKLTDDTGDWFNYARPMGFKYLSTNDTGAEANASEAHFDHMRGFSSSDWGNNDYQAWMWARARGYFDVVAYTGTGSGSKTINHNLGVVPEMMWVKSRGEAKNWRVYHKDLDATAPEDKYLKLNTTDAVADSTGTWNDTAPTATQFTVGNSGDTNNAQPYIAYLFATVAGVSKVGSVAPTGSALNVDCGFTNGARFVLMKRTDSTGEWFVWDSVRGIVSGNDPWLALDSTSSETTNTDYIDPHSSGFALTSSFYGSGSNFIFYAIA